MPAPVACWSPYAGPMARSVLTAARSTTPDGSRLARSPRNPAARVYGSATDAWSNSRVTVGTVFEDSHIPLHKWLLAAYLLCASKKGHERPPVSPHDGDSLQDGLVHVPSAPLRHDATPVHGKAARRGRDRRNLCWPQRERDWARRSQPSRKQEASRCIAHGAPRKREPRPLVPR